MTAIESGEVSCIACTATVVHALQGIVRCALPVGHYDAANVPDWGKADPNGWHQSAPVRDGTWVTWADTTIGATPHGHPLAPATEQSTQAVRFICPTCGPTAVEAHPDLAVVLRCSNCKEHLAHGSLAPTKSRVAQSHDHLRAALAAMEAQQ
ncbi:hypothetical protein EV284_6461 [Streptomyces sp. BK022]|uniref:hypothetical protein n=1 Tax=Streptomyces sp. BK022 TaxID=2512123 RepID=UPI00102A2F47|nr:hypothetical protein [Streptomyces sp. BK022]RZU28295.1 hypothetical protein EV284_6461 [Streptomyces sp. BK022]